MVLRIHVVRAGGHGYYVEDLVPGRAEGSPVAGEEPGYWWGGGAAALGRHDRVEGQDFAEVLAGRDPDSGTSLRAGRAGRADRTVSGYDLTFGAPKSVSVLHLLAPREIAAETGAAHRAAVDEALGYLERTAVGVRRSREGEVVRLPSTGMAAGVFLHRTSRALDPHLHTHVVAANVAQGVDGHWSAVDGRRVFLHAPAAQAVYHARLRLEIGERMGGAFDVSPSGLGDVAGVDRSLLRLFSQRAAAMDEHRHRQAGGRSWRGAYFTTRPDKDRTRTVESLRAEWRERAATFGFDLGDLTSVVGRRPPSRDAAAMTDQGRMASALDRLARQGRSLTRRDVVAEVAAASLGGASAVAIESAAARLIEHSGDAGVDRVAGRAETGRGVVGPEPRWTAGQLASGLEHAWRASAAPFPDPVPRLAAAEGLTGPGLDPGRGPNRSLADTLDIGRS